MKLRKDRKSGKIVEILLEEMIAIESSVGSKTYLEEISERNV